MDAYSRSSVRDTNAGDRISCEELGPVHRYVRRMLYDAGILSSLDVMVNEWFNQWEDEQGSFGFMIGVEVMFPQGSPVHPFDAMLTIACEPQGSRDDQERRIWPLLLSIREALVDSGGFSYVLATSDRLYLGEEREPPQYRRSHLGFNVGADLLREEQEWALR